MTIGIVIGANPAVIDIAVAAAAATGGTEPIALAPALDADVGAAGSIAPGITAALAPARAAARCCCRSFKKPAMREPTSSDSSEDAGGSTDAGAGAGALVRLEAVEGKAEEAAVVVTVGTTKSSCAAADLC